MAELREYVASEIEDYDDARLELSEDGKVSCTKLYIKSEADKFIAELEENHKKEVDRLLMKIAGLEKLVETSDKLLKPKGGFTIEDVKFGGIKLEGINSHKKEADK